jgi:hypothetical protein
MPTMMMETEKVFKHWFLSPSRTLEGTKASNLSSKEIYQKPKQEDSK